MSISLFFAGDVVISNPLNGSFSDKEIGDHIRSHDIACCNFEAPITLTYKKASIGNEAGRGYFDE